MSFSKLSGGLAVLLVLAGCQSGPLYGSAGVDPATGLAREAALSMLAGRIAVVEPATRTDQVVRNSLLFRLNGPEPVRDPLYEVVLTTVARAGSVSIQGGTGVPTASLYRLEASYTLTRLSDRTVVDSGRRFVTVPYDRSDQLFASQRALLDARERAGATLADQIGLALSPVLRREGAAGPSPR